MAQRVGLSKSTIGRIWKAFELQPHRSETYKLSNDPLFVEKVYDIVGLYLNPPEAAVVLCVDEKSQIQALARSQPAFPMMPGMPEKRTHDYVRHGTTSLFAAFDIDDGTVISALHRRHRAIEFRKFLATIDAAGPRPPRHPPGLRQLRHPQSAHREELAGPPSAFPHALHPNLFQLDQPSRTLVRRTHPPTHRTRRPPQRAGPRTRHPLLGHRLERQPQTLRVDQDRRTDPPVHRTINETNYRRGTLAA